MEVNACTMRLRRIALAENVRERRRAVAMFPLRVANLANDLRKLLDVTIEGSTDEADATMAYMEDAIRECYREEFGTELGM